MTHRGGGCMTHRGGGLRDYDSPTPVMMTPNAPVPPPLTPTPLMMTPNAPALPPYAPPLNDDP